MIQLTGDAVRVETIELAAAGNDKFALSSDSKQKMQASRDYIDKRISSGEVMYGVNTGFGAFSSVRISDSEIEELQRNLIRSHSAGIGEPFSKQQTRAMMLLRANALARGHSGIRPAVVEKILEFLNNDVIPVIPSQGSVGASGDLAPLSHLALSLMGEGECWSDEGRRVPVQEVLQKKNLQPLVLKAKEGLSLINGCQVMTAVGMLAAGEAREIILAADIIGALSLETLMGSRKAFDPLISATRAHPGEAKTARNLMKILGESSAIAESHRDCNRVQDAYSLRCMPAVHGAVKDTLAHVWRVLETEANSSTDNPLVFANENKVLSCGNFHGMPVAFSMDFAGICFSSLASISEQRIAKLINPAMSGLPAFLTVDGGLNSGHMIVQVAAASLVSENKVLAHPASVDSIPTSADKEDHVSMGTIAARKFRTILTNARHVLGMELLSSSQALDIVRPLTTTPALEALHALVREKAPYAKKDRVFALDMQACSSLIESRAISKLVEKHTGQLEW
jgi:histidine ammonia-lyase